MLISNEYTSETLTSLLRGGNSSLKHNFQDLWLAVAVWRRLQRPESWAGLNFSHQNKLLQHHSIRFGLNPAFWTTKNIVNNSLNPTTSWKMTPEENFKKLILLNLDVNYPSEVNVEGGVCNFQHIGLHSHLPSCLWNHSTPPLDTASNNNKSC